MMNNGIVIGIVKSLEDPGKLGRIRVTYPHLDNQESDWARLVVPMAGKGMGTFFRPEVGDEVLVGFLMNDIRFPCILGAVWNTQDRPPADDGKAKENNWRFIHSRSGHIIKLDDTKDKERIEFIDKDNARRIVIDCATKKIQIICDEGDVEINAPKGKALIHAQTIDYEGDGIAIKVGKKDVSVEAPNGSVKINGAKSVDIKSNGRLNLEGAQVKITAKEQMTLESNDLLDIKASGTTSVKGFPVKLN